MVTIILLHFANCKNIAILEYESVENCKNCDCTVGIPIESSSSLTEFSFCGKYRFKFLQDSVLMFMDGPETYIRILDFKENVGVLLHDAIGNFFFFPNQTIKPDSWQHFCLAISVNSITLILNGEVVFNSTNSAGNCSKNLAKNTNLWLGGENVPNKLYRRFEGTITDSYLWNESLEIGDLIAITMGNKSSSKSMSDQKLFSWETFKHESTSSCMKYQLLDENDDLFQDNFEDEDIILVEIKSTFDYSNTICQAFGGNLLIPRNDHDLNKVGSYIQNSVICATAFIGLRLESSIKKLTNEHPFYLVKQSPHNTQ